ncbi:uncharacterized protein Tco025E_03134 [Trypanosoma conorhini]|uniref:Uncharacterized protein n=1 Tax=Trypanosoma conorhini TaxID=83891 RepID=A0A422PXN0_9TRYP|nr:uncharacterized protein Tco025E_03134 [Trypanosoma conorhini]RNF22462.1 hypothetical protein Tco025E_03134 [Trypanosoma conorhini]
MELSAFEYNPFAEEEEDETTASTEVASRKRGRDEAGIEDPKRECASRGAAATARPTPAPDAIPASTAAATASNDGVPLQEEADAGTDAGASGVGLPPPVEELLTGYEERQEEDEFNALVVKAAGLESALKEQEKRCSDELDHMSQNNRELRETVELLRATILRTQEEIDGLRKAQSAALTECDTSHGAVELLGDVERKNGVLQRAVTDLTERLLAQDSDGSLPAHLKERLVSCILGATIELPDLAAFDAEAEKLRFKLCEEAIEKMRAEGVAHAAFPLVEALGAMLGEVVARYDTTYKSTRALQACVEAEASSLRELARGSLEWYTRSASRALVGGSDAHFPVPSEWKETALGNQHLEATLRHLESALHKLLQLPNVIAVCRQNAPSVATASAVVLCQELESHTEALGHEVLRLRRLLATGTSTLQQLSEMQETQEATTSATKSRHTSVKGEWLRTLTNNLLERLSGAEALRRALKDSVERRKAPAVELQLAFLKRYVALQETLLRLLCTLNGALQERVHIVSAIRQVALCDGDDTAVGVLAEKALQEPENDIGALAGELELTCTESLRKFAAEASELFHEEEVRAQQSTLQLHEVRNFFADTVHTLDRIVYGAAPKSGPIQIPLSDALLPRTAEANMTPFEMELIPSEDTGDAFVQMASTYHEQELQEEVATLQRRNSALKECLKWLSMQPSHGAVLRLRSLQKQIDAVSQKLAGFAEQETKWTALKNELATVRRETSAVQDDTAEMRGKLSDLRERLRAGPESGLP